MSIRSLIVKIGADTATLEKAFGKAVTQSTDLQREINKIGNTEIANEAITSLGRLGGTLLRIATDQQKVAETGVLAARGVEALGGPARLTRAQLEEVNRVLANSVDAFRALGQNAPKDLQRVADAVAKQKAAFQSSGQQAGLFGQNLSSLAGILGVGGGVAGVVGGLAAATTKAFEYADGLTKLSDRTGIGVVALQRLGAIAEASGNTLDEVAGAVNKFQKGLASGVAEKGLNNIGLTIAQLQSLSPDEQFFAIAKAIQQISNPAEQAAAAMELFGKGGAAILPTLKADIDALKDSTIKMSADTVKALDDAGDAFGRFKTSGLSVMGELAASAVGLLGALAKIPGALADAARGKGPQIPQGAGVRAPQMAVNPDFVGLSTAELNTLTPNEVLAIVRAEIAREGGGRNAFNIIQNQRPSLPSTPIVGGGAAPNVRPPQNLLAERRAIDEAKAAAEEYEKKLDAVNKKLTELSAPVVALTDKQKDLTTSYRDLGLSNADIAIKLGISKTSVDAYTTELDAHFEAIEKNRESTGRFQQELGKMATGLNRAGKVTEGFRGVMTTLPWIQTEEGVNGFSNGLLNIAEVGPKAATGVQKFRQEQEEAARKSKEWGEELDQLSRSFAQLAQVSGGSFGGVVKDIGNIITSLDLAKKASDKFAESDNIAGKGAALISGVAAVGQATGQGSTGSRVLGGAATGAQVGSIAGPWGSAVGAAAGAVVGLIRGLHKAEFQKVGQEVGRDYGVKISDELAKQIAKDSPKIGRQAATLLSLDKIIGESGGVASFGLDKAIKGAKDLFAVMGTGKLTAKQVGDEFDKLFEQILPNAISKTTGLASAAFVDLVKTAKANKIESPQLTGFVNTQLTGAASGLAKFLTTSSDASKRAAEIRASLADVDAERSTLLGRSLSDSEQKRADALDKQWDTLKKQLSTAEKLAGVTAISSQSAATGAAGGLLASFAGLRENGSSITDAVKAVSPAVDALGEQLQKTGFTGGAAFETLQKLVATASDELAGPAIDAVNGLGDAMAGLSNTGLLDQDTFTGLSDQVASTFNGLVAQGVDGDAALKLMQPTLQRIFELQEKFGFATDDATKSLLDQAVSSGVVGDQFKSDGSKMVDALGRTNDILEAIAKKLGADIPKAADEGAKGVDDAFKGINPKVNIDLSYRNPGFPLPDGSTAATGGLVTPLGIQRLAVGGRVLPFIPRGTDTVPAMLTPGEIVLNAAQQGRVAQAVASGGGPAVTAVINVNGYVDSPAAQRKLGQIVNAEIGRIVRRTRKGSAA